MKSGTCGGGHRLEGGRLSVPEVMYYSITKSAGKSMLRILEGKVLL